MAPKTRSSTGTAPTTPSRPRVSTDSSGLPTPGSTPRRTPHCTKCGRPRAGHPRSGCPYAGQSNPPSPSASRSVSGVAISPNTPDDNIAEELSSLHIVNPAGDKEKGNGERLKRRLSVRFALIPTETLASLSTTDSELVEKLLAPGMMSDTCNDEDHGTVLKWRKTLFDAESPSHESLECVMTGTGEEKKPVLVTSPRLSRRMPCTLSTPTASLTVTEPLSNANMGGSINMNETVYLLPDADVKRPKPLQRTLSVEQRSLFLERLTDCSRNAPASLISIPKDEVESVCKEAEKVGFTARVLSVGGQDDQRWVILGTDIPAIDLLETRFAEEDQKRVAAKRGGRFKAAAGGALFGAVATWTGLAFS